MDFKTYFLKLTPDERTAFSNLAETSVGMLNQVAYGHKQIELGFADVLVAKGGGSFELSGLPLTERAGKQSVLRQSKKSKATAIQDRAV